MEISLKLYLKTTSTRKIIFIITIIKTDGEGVLAIADVFCAPVAWLALS